LLYESAGNSGLLVSSQGQFVVIGIIGGVGSGKSTLARWLSRKIPVEVIDGDQLGHLALAQPEVKKKLISQFGTEILASSGEVDRSRLGDIVWGNHTEAVQARQELERIVHPVIRKSMQEAVSQARHHGMWGVIVDAAVMVEAGWHGMCDNLVFIDTPDKIRLEHVLASRHWTEEQWKQREASQFDLDHKRQLADLVIDNSGSLEQSGQQLLTWLHSRFGWSVPEAETLNPTEKK